MDCVKEIWLAKVHRELAQCAEKKYLSLEEYRSSDAYKTKVGAIEKWKEELEKIRLKKWVDQRFSTDFQNSSAALGKRNGIALLHCAVLP